MRDLGRSDACAYTRRTHANSHNLRHKGRNRPWDDELPHCRLRIVTRMTRPAYRERPDLLRANIFAGGAWRQILSLLLARCLHEHDLWSERRVELVRPERASMNRPGYKFPERLKILERRLVRIVIMRGRIV